MHEPWQHPDALHYWRERHSSYDCFADTALDLIGVPASQAYIECVFCLWSTDSRQPQQNDKIAWDAGQTEPN